MVNENYLNTAEAAKMLRKSTQTIRRWINKGIQGKTLAATKCGLDFRINPETLKNFLWELSK